MDVGVTIAACSIIGPAAATAFLRDFGPLPDAVLTPLEQLVILIDEYQARYPDSGPAAPLTGAPGFAAAAAMVSFWHSRLRLL